MRGTPDHLASDDALQRIMAEPWRYEFFPALRWIESQHPDKPRFGTARRPADEPVRLGQSTDMSFAPSSLHALTPATATSKARIEVRFFGLFGPNGPLPHHLTEYARQRLLNHGDATFARFADMFHHRMLLLFYRAWAQAQPTVGLDRPNDDRFAALVGSLVGIGSPELTGRDAVHDHVKLHFSGIFSNQVRNSDGLANVLTGFLSRPVRIEQFVGSWLELSSSERTRISGAAARRKNAGSALGAGAVLGQMVWDRQHKFRVHVGPLDHDVFESLLPEGKALPAVIALVGQYVGEEFAWDFRLGLKPDQVKPSRLGRHSRLGWTSWLGMKNRSVVAELAFSPRTAPSGVHSHH
jgi:type VI secretion system protein ImpH